MRRVVRKRENAKSAGMGVASPPDWATLWSATGPLFSFAMGKRRQQRVKTVLPVRIFGIDRQGKQFAELVHTLEISYSGVRLGGVTAALVPGSVVSVQCRLKKCQFTVAWAGDDNSTFKKQAGLHSLEPQRDLFGASLKDEMIVDDYAPPDGRVEESPASLRPVAAKSPPASKTAAMAKRLAAVTAELDEMDRLMQAGAVDPRVLNDFRDAVSRVRTTAWALQQWMDLEAGQKNPAAVLSYLNAERIAVATRLCDSLHQQVQRADISHQQEQLQGLLGAVERLFTRLAAMDLKVLSAAPDEAQDTKAAGKD